MALLDETTLGADAVFVRRVQAALVRGALAVLNEPAATANHAARVATAQKILADPYSRAVVLARALSSAGAVQSAYLGTNPPAQANVGDATLTAAVNGSWDLFAGVF